MVHAEEIEMLLDEVVSVQVVMLRMLVIVGVNGLKVEEMAMSHYLLNRGISIFFVAEVTRLVVMRSMVMDMVRAHGMPGFADHLEANGRVDTFINTLKMEPHYGGWMHGRCHGFRSIEGVAINHDINHLTVLNWAQTAPFYNDTFDWPQWPALEVSDSGVIEYFQSILVLGDPVGDNL